MITIDSYWPESAQTGDVAYAVLDREIVISVTDDRAKTTNMRRDPRVVPHATSPSARSYVAFSGEIELSPVTTDPNDATADELVASFEAVSGSPHPDWDESRAAMVEEGRLIARLRPSRAVGQING